MVNVISGEFQLVDPLGLHARPAAKLVELVKDSGLQVQIGRQGEEKVNAASALRIMTLKLKCGEKVTVSIESDDLSLANDALGRIRDLFEGRQ